MRSFPAFLATYFPAGNVCEKNLSKCSKPKSFDKPKWWQKETEKIPKCRIAISRDIRETDQSTNRCPWVWCLFDVCLCASDGRCIALAALVNPYFHFVFSLWRISLLAKSLSGCGSAFGFKVISQLIQLRSQRNSSKTRAAIGRCQQTSRHRGIFVLSACPTCPVIPAISVITCVIPHNYPNYLMITIYIHSHTSRNCPPNNPRCTIRSVHSLRG